jgi:hypothetical protein
MNHEDGVDEAAELLITMQRAAEGRAVDIILAAGATLMHDALLKAADPVLAGRVVRMFARFAEEIRQKGAA